MNCSFCGQHTPKSIKYYSLITKKDKFICFNCSTKNTTESIRQLDEIEEQIINIKRICSRFKNLIKLTPEPPSLSIGLGDFEFSPESSYEAAKATLASLKVQRLKLLSLLSEKERLKYTLKNVLQEENFERAGELMTILEGLEQIENLV